MKFRRVVFLSLGTSTNVIGGAGIVFNAGASHALLSVSTANQGVRLNGAVTLASDLAIDTGAGAGDITFTAAGTIDSVAAEHNRLTLSAGSGSALFNNNLGAGSAGDQTLGNLVITTAAGGVIFGGADLATIGGSGPLTTIKTNGLIDLGKIGRASCRERVEFTAGAGHAIINVSTANQGVRHKRGVTPASDLAIECGDHHGAIT